ncbi:MAG: SMP-30/gluconolactonase/LRE family protein [Planctomycetota bacterium]|nr:SMP-30/gluconolactonase/LRE family protein [Planctomycetota bacterium]
MALRYLPEGPSVCGPNQVSWVAIQHGADARVGSLNVLDTSSKANKTVNLPGRPGFAFPTRSPVTWLIGLERELGLYDLQSESWRVLVDGIDDDVEDTIVNDGVVFAEGVLFGTKHLEFSDKRAGLYLWRNSDQRLIRLRDDQICSNGKVVLCGDQGYCLLDIDSPTQTLVSYTLDVARGVLGEPQVVCDWRGSDDFPDGMIATPDGESVVVAFYNPTDVPFGEVRQYGLEDGALQVVWRVPQSPQVTCPQWVECDGTVKLVITTAAENMTAERLSRHPQAGSIFIAPTELASLPETNRFDSI